MYIPGKYKNEDKSELHTIIKNYNFGVIFSQSGKLPAATHLPFMLDEKKGKFGTLSSHMAKDNPQWKSWNNETEALIVFQGPHFYVSPAWYKNQATVPTWNYAAVHAYGIPKIITEPELIMPMLKELMDNHEKNIKESWNRELAESKMEKLLNEITAFEITITKIEGKKKFSQDKPIEDYNEIVKHACIYYPEMAEEIKNIMKK